MMETLAPPPPHERPELQSNGGPAVAPPLESFAEPPRDAAIEPLPRLRGAGHADQMLRQVQAIHVQLSQMADTKANMMLTVAALVIPLSVQHLGNPDLHLAAMTMIVFCALTVIFAAYAALPKLTLAPRAGRPDTKSPFFNILFFGDFTKLGYDDFRNEMLGILSEPQRTYEAQIREIYNMGLYLAGKKYKFVRLAYITFITGTVLSGAIYLFGRVF